MNTFRIVGLEWAGSDERASEFTKSVLKRLAGGENPQIAIFLERVFERFRNRDGFPMNATLLYACSVYRMLEVEAQGQLPVVSTDTGAPIQVEYLRDPEGFYAKLVMEVEKKNPVVLESVLLINVWYALAGDLASAAEIPRPGLALYKMLESQIESNRLSESLGY
ncbi:MAG: hypothetical protein WD231_03260 [Candidatus Woykebacteria bacterium]